MADFSKVPTSKLVKQIEAETDAKMIESIAIELFNRKKLPPQFLVKVPKELREEATAKAKAEKKDKGTEAKGKDAKEKKEKKEKKKKEPKVLATNPTANKRAPIKGDVVTVPTATNSGSTDATQMGIITNTVSNDKGEWAHVKYALSKAEAKALKFLGRKGYKKMEVVEITHYAEDLVKAEKVPVTKVAKAKVEKAKPKKVDREIKGKETKAKAETKTAPKEAAQEA